MFRFSQLLIYYVYNFVQIENVMNLVNVTELRQHLPDYLKQVQQGEEIITLHGKNIARIIPDFQENKRDAALKRLDVLRGKIIVGDVVAPLNESWTGDADNL